MDADIQGFFFFFFKERVIRIDPSLLKAAELVTLFGQNLNSFWWMAILFPTSSFIYLFIP